MLTQEGKEDERINEQGTPVPASAEYSDKAVVQSKDILAYLSFYPYIEPRRECTKLVVENERHESFATIDRMFLFLLQLTEVAEV